MSGESQFQVIGSNLHLLRVYTLNLCLLGAVEKAAKRRRQLRLFPSDTWTSWSDFKYQFSSPKSLFFQRLEDCETLTFCNLYPETLFSYALISFLVWVTPQRCYRTHAWYRVVLLSLIKHTWKFCREVAPELSGLSCMTLNLPFLMRHFYLLQHCTVLTASLASGSKINASNKWWMRGKWHK